MDAVSAIITVSTIPEKRGDPKGDLKRSMREALSNIYYRIYYYNEIMSSSALIAGKTIV